MKNVTQLPPPKKPQFRDHHLAEWLERRNLTPMDFWRRLNEQDDQPFIDKKQVYRWLDGQMPRKATRIRMAIVLDLRDPVTNDPDPEVLTRHPDEDWIARKLRNRTPDEIKRARQALEAVLPDRTGTDG